MGFRPSRWIAADGTPLTMRLARAGDTPQVKVSLEKLSPEARRNRFFSPMPGFSDQLVRKLTDVDPASEHVLLVMREEAGVEYPVAGGRFVVVNDEFSGQPTRCEFALVVGDLWQGQGIGRRILRGLIDEAAQRGLEQMFGHILADNRPMLAMSRSFGFRIDAADNEVIRLATLQLPKQRRRNWRRLLPRW